MATIDELRARVDNIDAELRKLDSDIGEHVPSPDQEERWGNLTEERKAAAKEFAEADERSKKLKESRAHWQSIQVGMPTDPFDQDVRTMQPQAVLSRSLAVVDSKDGGRHLRDDQKEHLHKVLRTRNSDTDGELLGRLLIATENPAYRSAFQKVAAQQTPVFNADEARAIEQVGLIKRAMSIGSPSGGGLAVPVLIDPTIIMTAQGSTNDILRLARLETITNDTWRGLSSAGVSWGFKAEAATATDNSPTIGQPEITTRRADGFIPFSIEIGMDWPGFAEQMSMLLAEGYDELLAEKLTTGTNGSNEPDGLITSLQAVAASKRELAAAGVIGAADIYSLWDALPSRFRRSASCAWMSSTDIQNSIRQLGTVDPNFTVNITQEAIPRLFGREYPMNDFMQDDPAGTGTQPLLVVGDFKGYVVAQRAGMTVEFIPMLFDVTNNRPTGQRGWFAWARVGGGVVNSAGFRLLTNRSA